LSASFATGVMTTQGRSTAITTSRQHKAPHRAGAKKNSAGASAEILQSKIQKGLSVPERVTLKPSSFHSESPKKRFGNARKKALQFSGRFLQGWKS
jgi:hypothetical protein